METHPTTVTFSPSPRYSEKWLGVGVGLAMATAVLLPLNLLATQRFHHDEALYATWAWQIASGEDPWLMQVAIDKPPLFLYTLAGSLRLLGATETAARLPSLLATVGIVALTFRLGQILYGPRVGVLAAWLVALSPFVISFAPTALTDPLLVALVLAGSLAAAQGQAVRAGVWFGLALMTKQQALFFLPLGLMLLRGTGAGDPLHPSFFAWGRARLSRSNFWSDKAGLCRPKYNFGTPKMRKLDLLCLIFLLTTTLTFLPALAWEAARAQSPGVWQLSLINYGGVSTAVTNLSERGWGFVDLLVYATASPLLNTIFGVGLPLLLSYDLGQIVKVRFQRNRVSGYLLQPVSLPQPPRAAYADAGFTLFIILFLLGHVVLSFQVWDRYLLGLLPLLALLLARMLWLPWSLINQLWPSGYAAFQPAASLVTTLLPIYLVVTSLASPVQDAVNARYPLGSNSAALSGIEQVTAYLRGHAGANNTLYQRWLGTHWHFYLAGYPYDLQYWASAQALAAKAQPGHLIAFPAWYSETEARLALAGAGLRLKLLIQAYNPAGYPSITLYRIERVTTTSQ